jgi:hypothetical protein
VSLLEYSAEEHAKLLTADDRYGKQLVAGF